MSVNLLDTSNWLPLDGLAPRLRRQQGPQPCKTWQDNSFPSAATADP